MVGEGAKGREGGEERGGRGVERTEGEGESRRGREKEREREWRVRGNRMEGGRKTDIQHGKGGRASERRGNVVIETRHQTTRQCKTRKENRKD